MRIRTIKPEFFLHDGLFDAEKETGLPLRVAFAGIWCACDREGRFQWQPRRLGATILPYDGLDFSRVLDALTTRGFLVKYAVGDEVFGAVPSWSRHQFVNPRETASVIPQPPDLQAQPTRAARVIDASSSRDDASRKERKGKEGKGREQSSPPDEPAKVCEPNTLFDALADACGTPRPQMTRPDARACGVALSQIRSVVPDVAPTEIARRAANYRAHFRDATLTPSALAKHWARCDQAPATANGHTHDKPVPWQRDSHAAGLQEKF